MTAPSVKLVILGDSSVGKTLLAHRFSTDKFDPHTANTIGAAYITKDFSNKDRRVKFEIWDTAGQERYRSLTPMYYRNAQVALICYDLSNLADSFEKAKFWVGQLAAQQPLHTFLVGNKSDAKEEAAAVEAEIDSYASENGLQIFKTSAKDGLGIGELFAAIVDLLDESTFVAPPEPIASGVNMDQLARAHQGCC